MRVARIPVVGRTLLTLYRAKHVLAYLRAPLANSLRWIVTSNETTNFTYDLSELNRRYLASLVADILNLDYAVIDGYISELENDIHLKKHIVSVTAQSSLAVVADQHVRFGRRVGWYAIVRAMKPRLIVETGVDKGLGSCILTAALKRNTEEGFPGRYIGTDINPKAGYLLTGEYAEFGSILYGDSITSLRTISDEVDIFINDSDHSSDYEYREYLTIASKLSSHALVLGDNAHCCDKLLQFSLESGRRFVFFQEKPINHWYPGGGIGFSFHRRSSDSRTLTATPMSIATGSISTHLTNSADA